MNKIFCLRFDIDTHVCMSKGMPALLKLAQEEGVAFTFFVNMGKGFDRLNSISNILSRLVQTESQKEPSSLSMFTKLGKKQSLIASFINPTVGGAYSGILRQAVNEGHDLGLHGGRNHAHWEKKALSWSYEKLYSEVLFGVNSFKEASLPEPLSFASPAWKSPSLLNKVLAELGFTHCANTKDLAADTTVVLDKLIEIPTNILGKAQDVGYIENLRALGYDNQAILDDFEDQLSTKEHIAIAYEHPFYAGVHEIELLRDMIRLSKGLGFTPSSLKAISQ